MLYTKKQTYKKTTTDIHKNNKLKNLYLMMLLYSPQVRCPLWADHRFSKLTFRPQIIKK